MTDFTIVKTNHTGITVSDIDGALAFFRDVLGFAVTDKVRRGGEAVGRLTGLAEAEVEIAFVEAPGHTIELLRYLKPDDRRVSDLRPCDSGHAHLAFEVDDIDAVLAAIRGAGFEAFNPPQTPQMGPYKGGRMAYTCNLDGMVLEFQQLPQESPKA